MMKDQFLQSYHQEPPPELAGKLRRRLAALPQGTAASDGKTRSRRQPRLAWPALAAVLLAMLLVAASPNVRHQLQDVVRQIGGLALRQTSIYPGKPESEVNIVPTEEMTLSELREVVPFDFKLPSWTPEGLTLVEETVRYTPDFKMAVMRWTGEDGRSYLSLSVDPARPEVEYIVGSDSVEEVEVNGETAALIDGGWDADSKSWSNAYGRTLRWQHEGVEYRLQSWAEWITNEDLVRVAESME